MSLTAEERQAVLAQLTGKTCDCGCSELIPQDHGMSASEWGISGAYVVCDSCEQEIHQEQ